MSDREDAREALKSVAEMRHAGMERGRPPQWFGILVALWAGVTITAVGIERFHEVLWLFVVVPALAMLIMRRRRGAWIAPNIGIGVKIAAVIVMGGLGGLSGLGGDLYGPSVIPPVAGLAGAIVAYGLFEIKCRSALGGDGGY